MVAPDVVVDISTVCAVLNVPPSGVMTGAATFSIVELLFSYSMENDWQNSELVVAAIVITTFSLACIV